MTKNQFKGEAEHLAKTQTLWELFRSAPVVPFEPDHGIVHSEEGPMDEVFRGVQQVSRSPKPVLIRGESGAGKEKICTLIHRKSERSGLFLAVNCARLASSDPMIIQAWFFGIGPNSGLPNMPREGRRGVFEILNGGTIFFDEIHRLPLPVQSMLLRFMEDQSYETATGELEIMQTDVRILFATNLDLIEEIEAGRFLSDLLARVPFHLAIPPLRKRLEDLPLLVRHFLASAPAGPPIRITDELFFAMVFNRWPGNVRELKEFIEGAVTCLRNENGPKTEGLVLGLETLQHLAIIPSVRNDLYEADGRRQAIVTLAKVGEFEEKVIAQLVDRAGPLFTSIWANWELQDGDARDRLIDASVGGFGRWLPKANGKAKPPSSARAGVFQPLINRYQEESFVLYLLKMVHDRLKEKHVQLSRDDPSSRYRVFERFFGASYERIRRYRPRGAWTSNKPAPWAREPEPSMASN